MTQDLVTQGHVTQAPSTQGPLPQARAWMVRGHVHHTRLRPRAHAFGYRHWFCLLPMRALSRQPEAALHRNARGWLAFHDTDHGLGEGDALAWLDRLLQEEGLWSPELQEGEVWLQTCPRALGYVFNPVSFWYVHGPQGLLHAIVVEVNSTFGQRHCYVLRAPPGQSHIPWGLELQASKCLHVSPFCQVAQGQYRFRFERQGDRLLACVDLHDEHGLLLRTAVGGRLTPLDASAARRAVLSHPLMGLAVMARIHWQAFRLWRKGLPVYPLASQPFPGDSVS